MPNLVSGAVACQQQHGRAMHGLLPKAVLHPCVAAHRCAQLYCQARLAQVDAGVVAARRCVAQRALQRGPMCMSCAPTGYAAAW